MHVCRPLISIFIAILASTIPSLTLWSQPPGVTVFTHPDLFIEVQDSVFVCRITGGGDLLPAHRVIAPSYRFEMVYDSTSRISYTVSELMRNGAKLRLEEWKVRRLVTAHIDTMSTRSRSVAFPVTTGDTISFYREFRWYDPKAGRQDTANFFSSDTLDYAVELVDAATESRLALLDSFGVLGRTTPGVPIMYGARPIIATVKYVIPAALNGRTAFMRIRLYARGDGEYQPIRLDDYTIGASQAIDAGVWNRYIERFGGGLGTVGSMARSSLSAGASRSIDRLRVRVTGPASIDIDAWFPDEGGAGSIAIYAESGELVFSPFSAPEAVGRRSAYHRFERSGTYFVTLMHDGVVLASKRIAIVK